MSEHGDERRDEYLDARDDAHLRYLALAHYALAALSSVCALIPGGFCCLGLVLMTGVAREPDAVEGGAVVAASSFFALGFLVAYCALLVLQAYLLSRRRAYPACVALAVLTCLNSPFGTVLGVLTLLVLMREPVKAGFGR
jgi:hypothetical protein